MKITADKLKVGDVFRCSSALVDVKIHEIKKHTYKNGNPYLEVKGFNVDRESNLKRKRGVISREIWNRFKPHTKVTIKQKGTES